MKGTASVLLVVMFAGATQAQGVVERATDWAWPEGARPAGSQKVRGLPSPEQRAYGKALTTALGSASGGAGVVHHYLRSAHDPDQQITARGVRVDLEDGTSIDRYQLGSEDDALHYALYGAELGSSDVLVEARGSEVVVVRGPRLEDPARASQILDAAWGSGLPTPAGQPSAAATIIHDGGTSIAVRGSDPVLQAQFRETISSVRSQAEAKTHGYSQAGANSYDFALENGVTGEVGEEDGILSAVIGMNEHQSDRLSQHLDRALRAGADSQEASALSAGEAVQGASGRLGGLFD